MKNMFLWPTDTNTVMLPYNGNEKCNPSVLPIIVRERFVTVHQCSFVCKNNVVPVHVTGHSITFTWKWALDDIFTIESILTCPVPWLEPTTFWPVVRHPTLWDMRVGTVADLYHNAIYRGRGEKAPIRQTKGRHLHFVDFSASGMHVDKHYTYAKCLLPTIAETWAFCHYLKICRTIKIFFFFCMHTYV